MVNLALKVHSSITSYAIISSRYHRSCSNPFKENHSADSGNSLDEAVLEIAISRLPRWRYPREDDRDAARACFELSGNPNHCPNRQGRRERPQCTEVAI